METYQKYLTEDFSGIIVKDKPTYKALRIIGYENAIACKFCKYALIPLGHGDDIFCFEERNMQAIWDDNEASEALVTRGNKKVLPVSNNGYCGHFNKR